MTSVVDTSVKHFHSAMVGAPILNGVAGSLIALLDACLVNGFDVKAATSLVVAGGVATLSFTGTHSATVDSVVLISGVTGALTALNGEQKVTAIGPGFIKFATAAADGAASGTVSFKMAPAGWLQPFVGTNLAVYKGADLASTGMSIRIDDTGTTSARVVGYEQMTDVNTGTGPFPTAAQMSGGGYWGKSAAASSAASPWTLVADGRFFMLHVSMHTQDTATSVGGVTRGFGDYLAFRPGGDPYACVLNYSVTATIATSTQMNGGFDVGAAGQQAMPRNYTGLGSGVVNGVAPYIGSGVSGMDASLGTFPSTIDGGLRLCRRYFNDSGFIRGDVPGLFHVPHSLVYNTFKARDIVPGTDAMAGRKLLALAPTALSGGADSTSIGISFVDITGPWR